MPGIGRGPARVQFGDQGVLHHDTAAGVPFPAAGQLEQLRSGQGGQIR
jgi:hypothetical protein